MAYKNKANNNLATKAPASPSYVDFEPKTELKEEGAVDTLIISLPGFKKEQLRVQVSSTGILKISGEKAENPEGTIKHRFLKETKVPENCDMNEIRAKFTTGALHVIMPKKAVTPPRVVEQPTKSEHTHQLPNNHGSENGEMGLKQKGDQGIVNGKMEANTVHDNKKQEPIVGLGTDLARLRGRKSNNVYIGLGVAMVAMVAIGAYVAYTYGSPSTSSYMEE
ncbi:22.0 kDa heat shock protein-like [Silene latifolia]|uniref:22.0 kDa heat shock protein-like n=1 Tax=Silene latifolia TaxID=37657 RepID=UPI003D76C50C